MKKLNVVGTVYLTEFYDAGNNSSFVISATTNECAAYESLRRYIRRQYGDKIDEDYIDEITDTEKDYGGGYYLYHFPDSRIEYQNSAFTIMPYDVESFEPIQIIDGTID